MKTAKNGQNYAEAGICNTETVFWFPPASIVIVAVLTELVELAVTFTVAVWPEQVTVHHEESLDVADMFSLVVAVTVFPVLSAAELKYSSVVDNTNALAFQLAI